jgi:hypothetical protein
MELVPLKTAFLDFVKLVGDDVIDSEYKYLKFGWDAEMMITREGRRSMYSYNRKFLKIDAIGGIFDHPPGVKEILKVYEGDYEYLNDPAERVSVIDDNGNWLVVDNVQGYTTPVKIYRQGEQYALAKLITGDITLLIVEYPRDRNDDFLVMDIHIPAIAKYMELRYLQSEKFRIMRKDFLLRRSLIDEIHNTQLQYGQLVRNARAEGISQDDEDDAVEIFWTTYPEMEGE